MILQYLSRQLGDLRLEALHQLRGPHAVSSAALGSAAVPGTGQATTRRAKPSKPTQRKLNAGSSKYLFCLRKLISTDSCLARRVCDIQSLHCIALHCAQDVNLVHAKYPSKVPCFLHRVSRPPFASSPSQPPLPGNPETHFHQKLH